MIMPTLSGHTSIEDVRKKFEELFPWEQNKFVKELNDKFADEEDDYMPKIKTAYDAVDYFGGDYLLDEIVEEDIIEHIISSYTWSDRQFKSFLLRFYEDNCCLSDEMLEKLKEIVTN